MTTTEPTPDEARFIFVICQQGSESAIKQELGTEYSHLRFAFSRPGFVTFKVDPEHGMPEKFSLRSALARTTGWSLGKVAGSDADELVKTISEMAHLRDCQHLHIWQRDTSLPGKQGFEPGISVLASELGEKFRTAVSTWDSPPSINQTSKPDEKIFDICLVEPDQWWFGYHYATTAAGRWPGGAPQFDHSTEVISRAYWKAKEALAWSGITVRPGDICAEIGSAPGGACQLLLEMGAEVIGIDPAEMEAEILEHKKFTHIRKRGNEVRKRDFRKVKWLFADLNLVPKYTLDTITDIVNHPDVDIRGLILTMKLADEKLILDIPVWIERVKQLGFSVCKIRQLAHNRQELCLAAAKDRYLLRVGKKRSN